jgi:hypothetical protein
VTEKKELREQVPDKVGSLESLTHHTKQKEARQSEVESSRVSGFSIIANSDFAEKL